jgi:hypothetical protein
MRSEFPPKKPDGPQDRYKDVPETPTGGQCNCPECCEARGEEPTAEMKRRHQRAMAMTKRLETK